MSRLLPILLALLVISYTDPVSCQVSLISAEGTFALLAGESVTCSFVSLGSIPDEVMWSRDGVELVKIMNRLKIQNFPGSSVVTFETADAIVPGNYTCFVRFGSDERRVTQEIVPAEYSLTVEGNAELLPGEDVLLFCNFTSNRRATSYEWTGNNGTTQAGQYLNITNVSYSDGGPYVCTVRFSLSTRLTVTVDVNVHDDPILSPSHTRISRLERKDTNISLDCNVTGVGFIYNWTFRGEEVEESDRISFTDGKLNIARVGFSDTGMYTCFVENRAGNATQFHNLTVFGSPDILPPNSTTVDVAINRQVSLFCRSVSYPGSSTSWMHYPVSGTGTGLSVPGSNTRLSVASSEELVITSANMEDTGTFMCNVTNEHGSATFNITLVVVNIPSAPVISTSDITPRVTSVTISWSQSVPSESLRVEEFVIELSANNGPFEQWAGVIDGDQRTISVTGLSPGVMYRLAMRSRNIAGLSLESNIVSFETATSPPELDFFNFTLSDDGRSILFQWRLRHDGGAPVNSFRVTLQSGDEELNYDANVNANRLLVTGLEPNTTYTVSVSLSNRLGRATPLTIPITTPQGPPGKPSKPVVDRVTPTTVSLTVTVESVGSGTITHCIVNVTDNAGVSVRVANVTATVTQLQGPGVQVEMIVHGLDRSTGYRFRVAAGGPYGHGEFSDLSDQETVNSNMLYIVIAAATVGVVILFTVVLIMIIICVCCIKKRKKLNRLTITKQVNIPKDFIYPSSSTGDKHNTMETSPPRDHVTTTFHTYTSVLHHQRTHSASSTSSQKKDMLSTSVAMSLPSTRFSPDQCSSSFFERNGLLSPHSVVSDKGWPSTPSITRLSYDADITPTAFHCATDV